MARDTPADRVGWQRQRAWMEVFSSAEMTYSSPSSGAPSNSRAYRSSTRAAFRSKSGSRGKIQDRKVQGRMASSASHRQMVASEMLEGTLVSTGSLEIHGEVNGEVSVQGEVVVTSESVVEADITAGSISLGGQIKGNLTAPGEVSLPPSS